jgi:hypothetical protein
MTVPSAEEYKTALLAIDINDKEQEMFRVHYRAHNRSIHYGAIEDAVGYKPRAANLMYCRLATKLAHALPKHFTFDKLGPRSDVDWCSSVIGMLDTTPRPEGSRLHLVMHHELATALAEVFPNFRKAA